MKISKIASLAMQGLTVFFFLLLLDPTDQDWGFRNNLALKYGPSSIAAIIVFFSALSAVARLRIKKQFLSFELTLIYILFISLVLGGLISLLAGLDASRTSLGRAAHIPFIMMFLIITPKNQEDILELAGKLSIFYSVYVLTLLSLWWLGIRVTDETHIFHEEIIFCSLGYLYSFYSLPGVKRKIFCLIALLSICFTFKNTGFLIALALIFSSLLYAGKNERGSIYFKSSYWLLLVAFTLIFIYTTFVAYQNLAEVMPSGSPEVRLQTYTTRITQFLSSPVYGTFYIGDFIFDLPGRYGEISVPSHSDLIDILAFGGLLGFTSLIYPIVRCYLRFFIYKTQYQSKHYFSAINFMICYLILMAFNPVLNQPKLVFFFWIALGYALAHSNRLEGLSKTPLLERRKYGHHSH